MSPRPLHISPAYSAEWQPCWPLVDIACDGDWFATVGNSEWRSTIYLTPPQIEGYRLVEQELPPW